MQRFFSPVTADQAKAQRDAAMLQSAAATASTAAAKALLKRRAPGRPRKVVDADTVIAAAADADTAEPPGATDGTCAVSLWCV